MKMQMMAFLGSVVLVASGVPAQDAPPVVTYGASRTSSGWVQAGGGQVAVDQALEWKGVKVYLSLTWDLVAVDAASGKTLWDRNVGAFWNELTAAEVEPAPGKKTWAVELRPGPGAPHEARAKRAWFDLRTGAPLLEQREASAGRKIEPMTSWSGRWADHPAGLRFATGNADSWARVVAQPYFSETKDAPDVSKVDFAKSVLVAIFDGETWNCDGIDAEAFEDDARILVRLHRRTFQTMGPDGGGQRVRPWGVFVLPRRDPFKPIVVERNTQNLIGGPALWKELCRFTAAESEPVRPKKGD